MMNDVSESKGLTLEEMLGTLGGELKIDVRDGEVVNTTANNFPVWDVVHSIVDPEYGIAAVATNVYQWGGEYHTPDGPTGGWGVRIGTVYASFVNLPDEKGFSAGIF